MLMHRDPRPMGKRGFVWLLAVVSVLINVTSFIVFRPNIPAVFESFFPITAPVVVGFTSQNPSVDTANNALLYLAYYYPWYVRDDWSRHGHEDTPLLGLYGTNETKIAEQHNDWARQAGIDVWVVSWVKQTSTTATHFREGMLKAKNLQQIKFCFIYESMGALPTRDFSNGTIAINAFIADMKILKSEYFSNPSYYRVNERPVVVLYVTRTWNGFKSSMLDQVREEVGENIFFIADEPFIKGQQSPEKARNGIVGGKPVFDSYTTYNMFEDALVQEGESAKDFMFREGLPIFKRWSNETIFFPNIVPRYFDFRGHKRLTGDSAGLITQLKEFSCLPRPSWYDGSLPTMMFITSWNEWWEGSQVEPDLNGTYGFSFIDTLKEFKLAGKQCAK